MVRVVVLIALASLIWVPIGVWVGLRPRVASIVQPIAQFLAAFPANLFFPIVVSAIVLLRLTPDIWLSPLMILGTQWYILFNVIVGASAIAPELRYAGENLGRARLAVVAAAWRCRRCFRSTSPGRSPPRAAPGTPASSPRSCLVGQRDGDARTAWARTFADATAAGDFQRIVLGHRGAEPVRRDT